MRFTRSVLGVDPGEFGAAAFLTKDKDSPAIFRGGAFWNLDRDLKNQTLWLFKEKEDLSGFTLKTHLLKSHLHAGEILEREFLLTFQQNFPGYKLPVVLEGLFVGANKQTVLILAEETGELAGPLKRGGGKIYRPLAVNWRKSVLKTERFVEKLDAENLAIEFCKENIKGIKPALERARTERPETKEIPFGLHEGALAEAACMAYYYFIS